jgi:mannosyltransferase
MSAAPAAAAVGTAVAGSPERSRRDLVWADFAIVTVPALLALLLCAVGITERSLGFDEAASVAIASQHGSAFGHAIAHDGGNMSGYYLLLHGLISLFGDGLLVIRAPSALATAATVALTGWLGLKLFGRWTGLIGGLLAAVSLPLVFWGQSARGYALMVALATGSFASFTALAAPEPRRPRAAWIAYVLCTGLAVYAGFVAALVVPAQLLVVARRRRAWPRVGSALAVAVLAWIPLAVLAATRGSGQLFWVPRPTLRADKQVLDAIASSGLEPSFHRLWATTAGLCLAGLLLLALGLTGRRRGPDWRRGLLLSWLLVPVALAWVESTFGQPIFLPRNLLPVLPAAALLLASALTDPRVPRAASWSLLAVLLVLRATPLAAGYGVSPEDWRSAAAYVLARAAPSDCVAFYPADAHMAFAYYVPAGARAPRSILPLTAWGGSRPFVEDYAALAGPELRGLPSRCPRLWLVSSHPGQPDGPAAARANLARFRTLRSALEREYPRSDFTTFGYAATITIERLSPRRQGRSVLPTKVM